MWSTRPHHSWITTTPGPLPDSGVARYPCPVPPLLGNSTICPMARTLVAAHDAPMQRADVRRVAAPGGTLAVETIGRGPRHCVMPAPVGAPWVKASFPPPLLETVTLHIVEP